MDCRHLEEFYDLFLLGALSEQSSRELREHLVRDCTHCLARIREAAGTVYLLSLTSKPARPHPRVKSELLHRLTKR